MKGVAFFDFDNTLIEGDAGPLFGKYLLRTHYHRNKSEFGKETARKMQNKLLLRYTPFLINVSMQSGLYRLRAVRRSQLVRSSYKGLKGLPAQDYFDQIEDFVNSEIPDRIYPEMVQVMEAHIAAGRKCVIISTGPRPVIEMASVHFPAGVEILACEILEEDGKLTGDVEGPLYGLDKANMIRAYTRAAGVSLKDCYAYSDHFSDKHMLEVVGHAYTVNPRGRLLELAQARGWPVLRPKAAGLL